MTLQNNKESIKDKNYSDLYTILGEIPCDKDRLKICFSGVA